MKCNIVSVKEQLLNTIVNIDYRSQTYFCKECNHLISCDTGISHFTVQTKKKTRLGIFI